VTAQQNNWFTFTDDAYHVAYGVYANFKTHPPHFTS
jgi:hypothetical protein